MFGAGLINEGKDVLRLKSLFFVNKNTIHLEEF